MRRRAFITLLGGAAAAWPIVARTQQGERMRRVDMLIVQAHDDPIAQAKAAAFRQEKLGWREGRNARIGAHRSRCKTRRLRLDPVG
jgi:putative tryptophan/tyrosine transport system substrate-binding protein